MNKKGYFKIGSLLIFLLITIFAKLSFGQITDCTGLMAIPTGTGSYTLGNNINCTGMPFTPIGTFASAFRGTLNGAGYTISNLNITTTSDYAGLFGFAIQATILNVKLADFNIDSTASYVGALVGYCYACQLTQISLTAGANCVKGKNYVGGIAGVIINSSNAQMIESTQTIVKSIGFSQGNEIGGLFGTIDSSTVSKCYNFGFSSSPSTTVVSGFTIVGGIAGNCYKADITKSGIYAGVVSVSANYAGGVCGQATDVTGFSELFSKDDVTIKGLSATASTIGGIAGWITTETVSISITLENVYSRATVNPSSITVRAGLYGQITFFVNSTVYLKTSYFFGQMDNSTTGFAGNVIGLVSKFSSAYTLEFSKVYYNNETNNVPGLGTSSLNSTDGSSPEGFGCTDLYYAIKNNFNVAVWTGNNLINEKTTTFGDCSCCPTTQVPTTEEPTTETPTTETPTTEEPTTEGPTTEEPTTETPTTETPTTEEPTTETPTTEVPTTETPTTETPTTETPTTETPTTEVPTTEEPTTETPTTETPTTEVPTTETPTTEVPTTEVPTTEEPTTETPTTEEPTTETPTTEEPTTEVPTTEEPTTETPTTETPTTEEPTTEVPTTETPTTETPTTETPTTETPTTETPTTYKPATANPTIFYPNDSCIYNVTNCQNCTTQAPTVDTSTTLVTCSYVSGNYFWSFQSILSSTMVINNVFLITSSTVIVQGNFYVGVNGSLSYVLRTDTKVQPLIMVTGCASINGNVSVQLTQPPSGSTTFPIISYLNLCARERGISKRQLISPQQLELVLNYENSECDKVHAFTEDSANATYLTVQYLGNRCLIPSTTTGTTTSAEPTRTSGTDKNLIIGLSVGLGGGFLIIALVVLIVFFLFKRKSNSDSRSSSQNFVENPSFTTNDKHNDVEMN